MPEEVIELVVGMDVDHGVGEEVVATEEVGAGASPRVVMEEELEEERRSDEGRDSDNGESETEMAMVVRYVTHQLVRNH